MKRHTRIARLLIAAATAALLTLAACTPPDDGTSIHVTYSTQPAEDPEYIIHIKEGEKVTVSVRIPYKDTIYYTYIWQTGKIDTDGEPRIPAENLNVVRGRPDEDLEGGYYHAVEDGDDMIIVFEYQNLEPGQQHDMTFFIEGLSTIPHSSNDYFITTFHVSVE